MAVTCDNLTASVEELLNSLLVKDGDGNYGLRTVVLSKACENLSPAGGCGETLLPLEQILRMIISPSPDCDLPAITLIQDND